MSRKIDPYNVSIRGVKLDPQLICRLFGISDMGQQQAIKKLLRAGSKHKTWRQDMEEAGTSIQRSLEIEEGMNTIEV
ncbi:hypothetical protein JIN85_14815 [Luteolibacter pohnpeiensis]|uniref:Uncharacterized protein n=1 Tax=Luteolibacter pohnpeiensis TaxID=454153 RepID=A0A934VVL9_9BACT|nr:hypothetical protein [Luteolibacter pohnpeiensis]MBK1883687.1 hypothetical protein [Luteolibacter pohnpeiensis]